MGGSSGGFCLQGWKNRGLSFPFPGCAGWDEGRRDLWV